MALQKILVVLGPPGSGKGTQSTRLAQALGYEQIVLGDLIRAFIKGDSTEAKEAKARYDQGTPQPDEIATMLLKEKLNHIEGNDGAVFDTYPLSMGQAQAMDEIVADLNVKDLKVVFLNVNKDEVVKRITNRGQARSDDKPEIAAARFDEYEKRNAPIKDHYRGKGVLIEINGDQPIDKVQADILEKIK